MFSPCTSSISKGTCGFLHVHMGISKGPCGLFHIHRVYRMGPLEW